MSMLLLRRSNPRFVSRGLSFTSLIARDHVVEYNYFGNVGPITAGQGSHTSDATGSVSSVTGATITAGQGSQTSDIAGVLTTVAAIDAGQGSQTSDALFLPELFANTDVGQGSQTLDIDAELSAFQPIKPVGWWDGANVTTYPGQSLWQMSPRFQGGGISRIHAIGYLYNNGIAFSEVANGAQWNPVQYTEEFDGFGAHIVRDTNAQPIVVSTGINAGAFGTPMVADAIRYVEPSSISDGAFGTHAIDFYARYLTLSGFGGESFGTLTISHVSTPAQYIAQVGTTYTTYGTASLQSSIRQIFAQAILPKSVGSHTIENSTRYITGSGWKDDTFGTPEFIGPRVITGHGWNSFLGTALTDVAYFNRTIYPSSVIPHFFNETPRVSLFFPYVYPDGIEPPTMFGAIVAIPPFNIIDCTDYSIDESGVGEPDVSRTTLNGINLYNKGIAAGGIGRPTLFPHYITPTGIMASSFGTTTIWNYIRYVRPNSLGIMVRFGTQWASFYIRYVYPTGWDSSIVWDPFGPIDPSGVAGHVSPGPVYIEPEGFDASGTTYDNCGFPRIPPVPRPSVT